MDVKMRRNNMDDDSARGKKVTQTGCKFSYTDAATITMTPNGHDSKATVIVKSGNNLKTVILSAALTCALSTSGAGGLDTGSEANSKGYYVFLITNPRGQSPKLLCSLSETNPTLPSGYTFCSTPIWFISNDSSGNIREFIDVNGTCFYSKLSDNMVLYNGLVSGASWAVIDLSPLMPNNSVGMFSSWVRPSKTTGTWNNIRIHTNNTDATESSFYSIYHTWLKRANKYASQTQHMAWKFPIVAAATSMYYKWDNNPGSGGSYPPTVQIYARGWRLQ